MTDDAILEALLNKHENEDLKDVAIKLGFTSGAGLSNRLKKLKDRIPDYAGEVVKRYAIFAVNDLIHQSQDGKTEATKTLLEMAGVYRQKQDFNITGAFGIQRIELPPKKKPGAPVDE